MIVNPTPHIQITNTDDLAKIVLMPGDPKRAEYIAKTFLTDVKLVNSVRGMLGFTGFYNGRKISVMGSGMGMPSIGIYSYELFKFYQVEKIVRIGSAGAYDPKLNVFDVVLVKEAYSESSYALVQNGEKRNILPGDSSLNQELMNIANKLNIPYHYERIHSSDVFYHDDSYRWQDRFEKDGCAAVEMESFALFHNAISLGKKAACLLTISDSFITHQVTTSQERETAFHQMMKIALELAE